jgi:hypothetical protein
MTSGEFHQLVALIQGQFMQIDRRLGQILGHFEEIARRLARLELAATPPERPRTPERE